MLQRSPAVHVQVGFGVLVRADPVSFQQRIATAEFLGYDV